MEAHYSQGLSVLRRIRESEHIWRELDELREAHRPPGRSLAALFDATIGLKVRNASYRAQLDGWEEGISGQVATDDLRAMVTAGLLSTIGEKRGTYSEATQRRVQLRAKAREGHQALSAASPFDLAS